MVAKVGPSGVATPALGRSARLRMRLPIVWRRLPWWGELLTLGCFYLLYELVRAVTPSAALTADRHADGIIDTERWAHVQIELSLNRDLSSVHVLASTARVSAYHRVRRAIDNGTYSAAHADSA